VVHRDVKPGNVLVGSDGVVKITDFGIAWSASSVALTQTGQVIGTAHYLAPEQAAGSKASPASDVYALGMIGYECLAGRRAFEGDNAVQIALMQLRDVPDPLPDDVPLNVRRLIGRALVKDPADRFPDGAAFRDAVDQVLAGRMLTPPPVGGGTVVLPAGTVATGAARARARWRRRVLAPAIALALGAVAAVAALQVAADNPPAPAAAQEHSSPLVLSAEDYVGRPVAAVEADLGALGLEVERIPEKTDALAPGLVTRISPTGAVSRGNRISVSYAVPLVGAEAAVPPAGYPGVQNTAAQDPAAQHPAAQNQATLNPANQGAGARPAPAPKGTPVAGGAGKHAPKAKANDGEAKGQQGND
jgi:serine/threonine-protein kinase